MEPNCISVIADDRVVITSEEYADLIAARTRIDILVDLLNGDKFLVSDKVILTIAQGHYPVIESRGDSDA